MPQLAKRIYVSQLIALAGSLLTFVQALFLATEKDGFCFSEGCEIVDSLTVLPPLFFNVGGFFFFQAVFWGAWLARRQRDWIPYFNALLLVGLAVEGVLVAFQYFIAGTFCTYCLVILGLVGLLNALCGLRQTVTGLAVFTSVLLAFSSLRFPTPQLDILAKLDTGAFAVLPGAQQAQHFLFFSSSCPHCEEVMAALPGKNDCTISFNPVDDIADFAVPGARKSAGYATDVNRMFLKTLGLDQIPVFLAVKPSGLELIKGAGPIKRYMEENCQPPVLAPVTDMSLFSPAPSLDFTPPEEDSCSVNIECDDPDPAPATSLPRD